MGLEFSPSPESLSILQNIDEPPVRAECSYSEALRVSTEFGIQFMFKEGIDIIDLLEFVVALLVVG